MEDGEENLETVDPDAEPEAANETRRGGPMVSEGDSNIDNSSIGSSIMPVSNEPEGVGSCPEMEDEAEGDTIPPVLSVKSTNSDDPLDAMSAMDNDSVQSCEERLLDSDSGEEDNSECETYKEPAAEDPVVSSGLSSDNSHPSSPVMNDMGCSLGDSSACNEVGDGADKVDSALSDSDNEEEIVKSVVEPKREPASALWPVASFEPRTELADMQEEEFHENADSDKSVGEFRELEVIGKDANFDSVDGISPNRTECEDVSKVGNINHDSIAPAKPEWEKQPSFDEEACHNGESLSRDSFMLNDERQECNLSVSSTSPIDRISDFGEDSNECSNKQICDSVEPINTKEALCERETKMLGTDSSENLSTSNVDGVGDPFNEDLGFEETSENVDRDASVSKVCDQEVPEEETLNSELLWDNERPKERTISENNSESQCNGDLDSHEHSQSEEMDWAASTETLHPVQQEEENEKSDHTEVIVPEGKRKLSCDGAEAEENSASSSASSMGATKMFKIDHNVAQLSFQQTSSDSGCSTRAPQVLNQQPVEGGALFPEKIQGNSHLNEYAQYLGLQPTVKFKCVRCGEKSFSSMMDLKTHQYACLKNHTVSQPSVAPSHSPPFQTSSTNFRITRKVYLCSVCGTYYENWNLFLHMREVHKRHICLVCLGMFSQAERLAAHLVSKHNIVEGQFDSAEEFRLSCKGSVFLMCCTCEKVFSEQESFSNHPCKERSQTSVTTGSNSSLVFKKSQGNNTSHQSVSASFIDRSKTISKQFVDLGSLGRSVNSRQAENKLGKVNSVKGKSQTSQSGLGGFDTSGFGSSNYSEGSSSGKATTPRPKQILKVKIPTQPKKQDSISVLSSPALPALPVALSSSAAPTATQPPTGSIAPSSEIGSVGAFVSNTHSEMDSEEITRSEALSLSQLGTDENYMSNLDRTINAVALGITSEAMEWQQRKDEEMKEIEEPSNLLLLNEAAKSDSESDGESIHDYPSEENINSLDSPLEMSVDPVHEPERPDPPSCPVETSDHLEPVPTSPELSQDPDEELPNFNSVQHPEPAEAIPEEPTLIEGQETLPVTSSSPVPPNSPPVVAPTPAEDESDLDTDSDKLSLVVDETPSGAENEEKAGVEEIVEEKTEPQSEAENSTNPEDLQQDEEKIVNEIQNEKILDMPLAGEEVPITEVMIEECVEDIPVQSLLKECVKTLCYTCVYCSHARRIAVNGKQLALHTLAEHRFSPVDGTDKVDPSPQSRFISKLRDSLQDLQDMFFNTDTYDNTDKSSCIPYDRTYECFHCHFYTKSHKELYIHNRKMHQKTILLCIMCKSNFYSYSELLCHLCPGIYIPQCNVGFHCCMCDVDNLPSAFRLMVHLRKKHHTCDVCLEITDDQQKLSSHVWKHKLHHLCYRCGIAYRNKPDITNHLFWKHGTESVLCKKCLQKKWPHVYHFCVPPATFTCEECNSLFTKAVSLRVHKRLHSGEQPHQCTECEEKFVSKKLLAKHTESHRTPPPPEAASQEDLVVDDNRRKEVIAARENNIHTEATNANCDGEEDDRHEKSGDASDTEKENAEDSERDRRHGGKKKKHKEKEEQKQRKVVDVYDLPPLNLSSESDSSDEDEKKDQPVTQPPALNQSVSPVEPIPEQIEERQSEVVDGIWDKFQSYKASLEKLESVETTPVETPEDINKSMFKVIMMDHDYCLPENSEKPTDSVSAAAVTEDSEKQQASTTDPVSKDGLDLETITVEENPPSTPPHSKDDSKSVLSSESPTKKKRSPKKKIKRRSSSSSSNSSSGSDSSSCSCGTNCSCSSSSSSDSSSSSSDSDSSSSEGKRRALERRESRKDKSLEKKKDDDDKIDISSATLSTSVAAPVEAAGEHLPIEEPHIDVMEPELTFRESDFDTTETDTDEDFYDERPQKPPDESQVEKRNLLLLASVAPLNNGGVSPTQILTQQSDQLEEPLQPQLQPEQQLFAPSLNPAAVTSKKKAKKRKKKQTSRYHSKLLHKQAQPPEMSGTALTQDLSSTTQSHSPVISSEGYTSLYYSQTAPSPVSPAVQNYMTPPFQQSTPVVSAKKPIVTKLSREIITNAGSGSETEGRTKRKRMPNKFYGYSSDEETEEQHHTTTVHKWRKIESSSNQPSPATSVSIISRPLVPPLTIKHSLPPVSESVQLPIQPSKLVVSKTDSDSESESKRVTSSSSSSDSDDDAMHISETPVTAHVNSAAAGDIPVRESNDNLYCYCQCPYDEVSEMIACDGKNCAIEWFHFECVGIMVPPKGQWYCPDCRKNMTNYVGSE